MSIAILASGDGSNFQVLVEKSLIQKWPNQISLLFCDRPSANVVNRARQFNLETLILDPKSFLSKEEYEQKILRHLVDRKINWLVLAGYMRIIGLTLLNHFPQRIINIHPSLLPAFPGKNAIKLAFEYGVKVSGVTIHYVDEGIDSGPIIAQAPVCVSDDDTLETFTHKIHLAEHKLYPETVRKLTGN